jgi:plasmid stability protein
LPVLGNVGANLIDIVERFRMERIAAHAVSEGAPFDRAKEVTIGNKERNRHMIIELPEELGAALKAQANAHGVSADGYARELLKRDLASSLEGQSSGVPFKTGRGMFAKYGQAPSAEEIDANRADMFRNFGEDFL